MFTFCYYNVNYDPLLEWMGDSFCVSLVAYWTWSASKAYWSPLPTPISRSPTLRLLSPGLPQKQPPAPPPPPPHPPTQIAWSRLQLKDLRVGTWKAVTKTFSGVRFPLKFSGIMQMFCYWPWPSNSLTNLTFFEREHSVNPVAILRKTVAINRIKQIQ